MKQFFKQGELFTAGYHHTYSAEATQAVMLLGGIGTGCFGVGSRGQLQDWELFNQPDKGNRFPYSFFAMRVDNGTNHVTKVLEAQRVPPFAAAQGFVSNMVAGLPRFEESEMSVHFPFVDVKLKDQDFPLDLRMEAFNPFIPLNEDDSGIPAVVIRYHVRNRGNVKVEVSIAGSLYNASGFDGHDVWENAKNKGTPVNRYREDQNSRGIYFDNSTLNQQDLQYGNLSILTKDKAISYKPEWNMGQRNDGIHDFWDDFSADGYLDQSAAAMGKDSKFDLALQAKIGSLAIHHTLHAGEEYCFEFVLSWYFPNRIKAWPQDENLCKDQGSQECTRNYYSTLFDSSWCAGTYLISNLERLENETRSFTNAVYASTLPDYVLDAMTANLTVLKSPTCFRIENGHMFGFEGCLDHVGSCPGNCTHVWYYAQAMACLFPALERSMRETDFLVETAEDGAMQFRAMTELNGKSWGFIPAVDGQMGTIVRLYREWLLSGDDDFLKKLWPQAVKSLDYAVRIWDTDEDGVLDGMMHVDYDVEFYGPNPLGNICYLAALKAAIKMAEYLKDEKNKQRYQILHQTASKKIDQTLWNGEYFSQILEDVDEYKYQHGTGCLADQLIGQYMAYVTGLGAVLDPAHLKRAAYSIFAYNFKDDFSHHTNVQRTYALGQEKGLLMTTWPHGGRPRFPFFYSDEVWGRTEYHVAATLIYEGFLEEGLTVVKAVRQRYDGYKRNPWNEFECGFHYAGNMSSWGLLLALSGFHADLPHLKMSFSPKINQRDFQCFWCNGKAWGNYRQKLMDGKLHCTVETLYGELGEIEAEYPEKIEKEHN